MGWSAKVHDRTLARLAVQAPDLHAAVSGLPIVEDEYHTATIATDGRSIFVAELFGDRMTDGERLYAYAFVGWMIHHDALGRRGSRDHRIWDFACNIAAHADLSMRGFHERPFPTGACAMPEMDGLTAAEIYDRLLDHPVRPRIMIDMMVAEQIEDTRK